MWPISGCVGDKNDQTPPVGLTIILITIPTKLATQHHSLNIRSL